MTVLDPTGKATRHDYDFLGRLIRNTYPDAAATFEAFAYDDNGNLVSKTKRDTSTIAYTYWEDDSLRTITYPGAQGSVSYQYNRNGDPTQIAFGGRTLAFECDARRGWLSKETLTVDGSSFPVQYTYDSAGNVLGLTYPDMTLVSYDYDGLDRTEKVRIGSTAYGTFTYRADGLPATLTFGNGLKTTYTYDDRGRPDVWTTTTASGSIRLRLDYGFNGAGDVASLAIASPTISSGSETFAYDGQDRLRKWTASGTPTSGPSYSFSQEFTYDAAGNRLVWKDGGVDWTPSHEEDHRLRQYGPTGSRVTLDFDGNGNVWRRVQGPSTRTFAYDAEDRLVEVKDGTTVVATYAYDGLGRRVKATESGTTTYFVFSGLAPLYTKQGTTVTKFLYAGGQLLARLVGTTPTYVHVDQLGSVRLVMDSKGNAVFEAHYRPFGAPYRTSGTDPRLKFAGEWNEAPGLYYLFRRHYDPETGRFLQPDPVLGSLSAPQTLNRYPYIVNNPLRYVDPEGLKTTGRDPRAYAGARLGMGCIEDCEIDWRALGDVLFTAIGFLPVVGDIAATAWFLAWDAYDCLTVGCNWANIGLDALGILPGVPNLGGGARVFARIGAVVPLPFLGGLVRHGDEAVELARGAGRGGRLPHLIAGEGVRKTLLRYGDEVVGLEVVRVGSRIDVALKGGKFVEMKTGKYVAFTKANRDQLEKYVREFGAQHLIYEFHARQVSERFLRALRGYDIPYYVNDYPF